MAWVKSEYADELAVLSTWIAVLLPWTAAYTDEGPLGSVLVFLRLGLFEVQMRFPSRITFDGVPLDVAQALAEVYAGMSLGGNFYVALPHAGATAYPGNAGLAYWLYAAGAAVLFAAFLLSLAVYAREDAVSERLPLPYVRLAGYALGLVTLLLAGATALLATADTALFGFPVPVGLVIMAALAAALLGAETVPAERESPTPPAQND